MADQNPLEGLNSRLRAFEALTRPLEQNKEEALSSAKRLAHSLLGMESASLGLELTSLAKKVKSASDADLPKSVEKLCVQIRKNIEATESGKKNILIVDDDEFIRRLVSISLGSENRKIIEARSRKEFDQIVDRGEEFDLVLLDLVLPDADGRNILSELVSNDATKNIPVIVMSSKSDNAVRIECLALGANDYLKKPFDPTFLATMVSEKLRRYDEIERSSRRDPLTQLPNRASLRDTFIRTLALAGRGGTKASLAIIDLDHFKDVNDIYGHKVGDDVLKTASSVILSAFRKTDTLARWGGEEFVAIFPETSSDNAATALESARTALEHHVFATDAGKTFNVTFSAGVIEASYDLRLEDAVASADVLLYKAKKQGRNRVISSSSNETMEKRSILVADDDEGMFSIVAKILQSSSTDLLHARTAEEAYELLTKREFAMAILDVGLPQMNGIQLLHKIRALPGKRGMKVVMLSSQGSEVDIVRGFDAGADDYVVKPFSSGELSARVKRLLR